MIISPYKKPPVTPPPEHPRLMLRRKDIERISCADRNSTAWRQYRELCEFSIDGKGAMPEKGTYHLKEYLALEAKALESLLENDAEKGRGVIEIIFLFQMSSPNFIWRNRNCRESKTTHQKDCGIVHSATERNF